MHKHFRFAATLLAAAVMTTTFAHAATLAKADYAAGKTRISADYKAAQTACKALSANAKDICMVEAKGAEKVSRAELEFSYTGKAADNTGVYVARADAAYAVAKEKCDDMSGNDKDVCVKQAKAVHAKGLAEAKLGKKIGEARSDAAGTVRDANYALAAEKCDAMSGDAKASCLAAAKANKAAPVVVESKPAVKKDK
jgi:hypothetical protein